MSNKPISPLRQRMIDDMRARRFSEDTQRDYVRNVRNFAAFLGQSPDTATNEDLRRFQLLGRNAVVLSDMPRHVALIGEASLESDLGKGQRAST